jgi:plastocyanin
MARSNQVLRHTASALLLFKSLTATSAPTVHSINVGGGGLHTYDPDTTYADIGDVVAFKFFPTNHSVTRGVYSGSKECGQGKCNPCIPYEIIHPNRRGFNSGNILTQVFPSNSDVRSNILKAAKEEPNFHPRV